MSGTQKMSRYTVADQGDRHAVHRPARLEMILLVVVGLSLVGAGAFLWSRHGASVFVDNPILTALAWCF